MLYDPEAAQAISRAYIRQQTDSRPIVHGLRSEPRLILGLSPWVWKWSAALAAACWIADLIR